MPALNNIRHELFCQGLVSGLSQVKAYTSAGYSEWHETISGAFDGQC